MALRKDVEGAASRREALGLGLAATAAAGAVWLYPRALGSGAVAESLRPPDRLSRLLAKARRSNPIDPEISFDGYGPLARGTVAPVASPAPGSAYQDHTVQERADVFTLYGGARHMRFDDWQALSVSYPDGHAAANTGRVAFMTDADAFELIVAASATAAYRVLVDGLYISRSGVLAPASAPPHGRLRVHLPGAPGRPTPRRIDVEMCSPEGAFGGVATPAGASLGPVDASGRYRIACVGDSFSQGTGCLNQNDAWNVVAGYLLGGVDLDMVQVALGGTGFVRDGPTWRAIDHISDLAAQVYDELWIELGENDADVPQETTEAAARRFFAAARRMLPGIPILVLGVPRDDSLRAERAEQTIHAAYRAWGDRRSAWIGFQTPGAKLFTGSVAGGGTFAPGVFGGGVDGRDDTHPNVAGHRHMGGLVARARRGIELS